MLYNVSDLHLRGNPKHNRAVIERLWEARDRMGPDDALVVTGDITDDGKEDQYVQARELLRPFAGRLVLAPGNHDFGPWGNLYTPACARRFDQLRADLQATGSRRVLEGGVAVGEVVVVDTCLRTGSPLDFAQGKVGRIQRWLLRRRLDQLRAAGLRSVVALHHNPWYQDWTCRMQDAKAFLDVVTGRADVVLCGHEHRLRHTWFPQDRPEAQACTRFYAADALCYDHTEILAVPLAPPQA